MHKAIHAPEDKDAARQKASLVAQKLKAMKLERIASFVETCEKEMLSFYVRFCQVVLWYF